MQLARCFQFVGRNYVCARGVFTCSARPFNRSGFACGKVLNGQMGRST